MNKDKYDACQEPKDIIAQTRMAFIWTRLLGVPFWGMLSLFPVILYKEMHITPWQINIISTLKPMSALFALYCGQSLYLHSNRLISHLVKANILRYLPFLFFPWIHSAWLMIGAFGLYMTFYRGGVPAWMETVKSNLPEKERERLTAFCSTLDYAGIATLPFLLGLVLDNYDHSWRLLFPLTASLGLMATFFLRRIPTPFSIPEQPEKSVPDSPSRFCELGKKLLIPWKGSWQLIKDDRSFFKFQVGFMLGGSGLMIIQPVLPLFFIDILNLSYTKMLIALTLFKGAGFISAMPLWVRLFRRWNIYHLSGLVTLLSALFPLMLLCSRSYTLLLYFAYGLYGTMQAGSDLTWHLSGPIFAKEKNSTIFSGTNVLAVGIRGCIIPPLGAFLYGTTSSVVVMLLGSLLSLFAFQYLLKCGFEKKFIPK